MGITYSDAVMDKAWYKACLLQRDSYGLCSILRSVESLDFIWCQTQRFVPLPFLSHIWMCPSKWIFSLNFFPWSILTADLGNKLEASASLPKCVSSSFLTTLLSVWLLVPSSDPPESWLSYVSLKSRVTPFLPVAPKPERDEVFTKSILPLFFHICTVLWLY